MSDDELQQVFREEAEELVRGLGRRLLELESSAPGEGRDEVVRHLFRMAHTLKGSAATAQRNDIAQVAHTLESCLDAVRKGVLAPEKRLVSASLLACDALAAALTRPLSEGEISQIEQALQSARSGTPGPAPPAPAAGSGRSKASRKRRSATGARELEALCEAVSRLASEQSDRAFDAAAEAAAALAEASVGARTSSIAASLHEALSNGARRARARMPLIEAAVVCVDYLQTEMASGASDAEAAAVMKLLSASAPAVESPTGAAGASPASPPTSPAASSERVVEAASGVPQPAADGTVRIPVSLLDSILYRLDELVAVKLRIDYQRRQIEEALESVDLAIGRARLGAGELSDVLHAHKRRLENVRRDVAQEVHHLGVVAQGLQEDLKEVRMVPVGPTLDPLRRTTRDLAERLGKEAVLEVEGEDVRVDKRLLELIRDPLNQLLRNALAHGIEPPDERAAAGKPRRGRIRIAAESRESQVFIEVQDDGRGISAERVLAAAVERGLVDAERARSMTDREALNLIFAPGFSTASAVTEISGRGVGLDVVRENVARLGGRIDFFTEPGRGTKFNLRLPLTLVAARGLLVIASRECYCLPLTSIEEVLVVEPEQIGATQGRLAITWRNQAVTYARLHELLAGTGSSRPRSRLPAVVLALSERRLALGVDDVLGQEEIVVKGPAPGTPRLPFVAGATSMADGRLVTVLDPAALVEAASVSAMRASPEARRPVTVLVVDDSLTSRTMIAGVLEQHGYQTVVAHDGEVAWATLMRQQVDLVVSDVEMPVLDGLSLVRRMRANDATRLLPVVLLTSLEAREDQMRGAEAGADAYVVKHRFDAGAFLAMVHELVGAPREAP